MAFTEQSKGGKKGRAGRKSTSDEFLFNKRYNRFQDKWWNELERLMDVGDSKEKQFAMEQYNRLQVKKIPQDITSGGGKINQVLVKFIDGKSEDNRDTSRV